MFIVIRPRRGLLTATPLVILRRTVTKPNGRSVEIRGVREPGDALLRVVELARFAELALARPHVEITVWLPRPNREPLPRPRHCRYPLPHER